MTLPRRSGPPVVSDWRAADDGEMARKHRKPEEIVAKLRQVEVLLPQGKAAAEAVRTIGVTEQSYY